MRRLEALAQSMPAARKQEQVPKWFVLAANLSLEQRGEHAVRHVTHKRASLLLSGPP